MSNFKVHDLESTSDEAKALLEKSINAFQMIPNLHGVMAESPSLLEGYQKLHELAQKTSFDKTELTVVWQTINVEHECHYCVPAHTAIAHMMSIEQSVIEGLRNETPLPDKLEQLRKTTLSIIRERGLVKEEELDRFYNAGYSKQNILEIILILSQKVMSNYVNHLAKTPVDGPFEKFSWEKR